MSGFGPKAIELAGRIGDGYGGTAGRLTKPISDSVTNTSDERVVKTDLLPVADHNIRARQARLSPP